MSEQPKPTIWYAGVELKFRKEYKHDKTICDELQALIDWNHRNGKEACCLHENGKHQFYSN